MRAALYHRVSTTDQRPEAARDELRQAATHRQWPVVLEVEETGSGMLNDRPGLLQVMGAARKRQVDVLIVWKLDRFGRSALDILANVHTLRNHGVQLLCSSQGLLISDRPDPMLEALWVRRDCGDQRPRDRAAVARPNHALDAASDSRRGLRGRGGPRPKERSQQP